MDVVNPSRLENTGNAVYRIIVVTVCALLIGLTVSLAAIAFVELVVWLNNVLLVSARTRVQYENTRWIIMLATLTVPVLGGLVVGTLIYYFSPEKRPVGPPDVIKGVQLAHDPATLRGGITSTAAAIISLGSGASVGQYGPLVYLGAMIGNVLGKLNLRIPNFPAIAMSCGVAAVISTAFNAPIAGLVFAHEVILRHYSMQSFAPTTVAAATGYVVANVVFEREALFLVDFEGVQYGHEFLLFAVLGLFASAIAILFMRLTLKSAKIAGQSSIHPILRPACAGLAVGIAAIWLPDVMGVGRETLRFATIEGAFFPTELAVLIVAKMVLTALCIGFGFSGGVFSPALLIGILFGALSWTLIDATGFIATSGIVAYAICGMMAVASAVIGAPLTTILIVFELTRNYDLTVAAMVAVVFSNLVTYRAFGRSLFDIQLANRGIDLSVGRDRARLSTLHVSELISTHFGRCASSESLEKVYRNNKQEFDQIFVVDKNEQLVGLLDIREHVENPHAEVSSIMCPPTLVFDHDTSLPEAMRALEQFVGDFIPVIDKDSKKLTGVVTESAIIKAYLDAVDGLRNEENASA